ncbi:UDP-glucose 4-epimerase family protein [Vibrio breoganii]
MRIFVTGATGFVGSRFYKLAKESGLQPLGQSRTKPINCNGDWIISCIGSDQDWSDTVTKVDCIVHCAARVHQMNESVDDANALYQEVNVLGTLNLARQAADAGVKRFVFLSSIKVNGESTSPNNLFQPGVGARPSDPYGASKWDAEQGLLEIAKETGLEVVIIRPPLVYGPGVKANFHSLLKWVDRAVPLPLGAIKNQRSMVFLDNLASLMLECCENPNAVGQTFLVSDDHDISTSGLLKEVATAMKRPYRMLPIPESWLKLAASLLGKKHVGERLCSSLQLDISHTKQQLGWVPPVSFSEGIKETVDDYLKQKGKE